jgi:hypothetical protein
MNACPQGDRASIAAERLHLRALATVGIVALRLRESRFDCRKNGWIIGRHVWGKAADSVAMAVQQKFLEIP